MKFGVLGLFSTPWCRHTFAVSGDLLLVLLYVGCAVVKHPRPPVGNAGRFLCTKKAVESGNVHHCFKML